MAADALLVLHFLWVVFMVSGFPLALLLKSRVLRLAHAAGLSSYLLLAACGWYCPLTVAETYFRRLSDPGFSYHGSFLGSWIERLIYVDNWGAPLWIFRLLAGLYLALCLSSWWWWQPGVRAGRQP
ncbi:MAG: DUF2784 family protein [candidate division FCPU426 bacterium]